jgi:hypothetical protein
MCYRPFILGKSSQISHWDRNALLREPNFWLDVNGAFRPKQRALHHRQVDLKPGTHPRIIKLLALQQRKNQLFRITLAWVAGLCLPASNQ